MIKVLAIDMGFCSTGLAVVRIDDGRPGLFTAKCIHTKPQHRRRGIYVAHDDVCRAAGIARGITEFLCENGCSGIVCELPSGGAQGAKANRAMGIATGLIACLTALRNWPVEWITPNESRKAAIGRETAPKGKDIKMLVIKSMEAKYGSLKEYLIKDREHIADALAAFEAAKDRQMIRTLIVNET